MGRRVPWKRIRRITSSRKRTGLVGESLIVEWMVKVVMIFPILCFVYESVLF